MNSTLRQKIFEYQPPPVPSNSLVPASAASSASSSSSSSSASLATFHQTLLCELQRLFAFLLLSEKGSFSPDRLVKVLQLQTGEQQDAQELSKLLLTTIEDALKV